MSSLSGRVQRRERLHRGNGLVRGAHGGQRVVLDVRMRCEAQTGDDFALLDDRKRALGGGDDFDLATVDQLLLTVVWLRQYPTNEVLGFLFGVSDSTAGRARSRCLQCWSGPAGTRCGCPTPGPPAASGSRRCSRTRPGWRW